MPRVRANSAMGIAMVQPSHRRDHQHGIRGDPRPGRNECDPGGENYSLDLALLGGSQKPLCPFQHLWTCISNLAMPHQSRVKTQKQGEQAILYFFALFFPSLSLITGCPRQTMSGKWL